MRAQQAGNPEKRRHRARIADGGLHRGNTRIDFALDARQGHLVEGQRVVLAMGADDVAAVIDAAHRVGVGLRHPADQEVGDLHAFRRQRVEDSVGIGRQRTVIESNDHLMVVERQRGPVLHAANARQSRRIDRNRPAGAQGIRVARARVGHGRGHAAKQAADRKCSASHSDPRPPSAPFDANPRWRSPSNVGGRTLTEN
jgi:hypothetical protein